ncbi:GntR family transcriptional regulator [Psychromarinibacter sp. C21-152]|uniref:GntR family transcriptional regulator n=1 Tax=Psychromarinibacter sediminicola TaxID=3033385 RepID=A0AAE3NYK3_9RHOB|nr:GntR family transcriptional regulator [Psychromarinibacter sediminicola]MDF0603062.1 GntR family transcriptional regulator [Psychromarinibacter sediminicola]
MARDTARTDWQALADRLSEEIILGRRMPRERLIEDDLIAESSVTRHAVRRAFDELERRGLAHRQPNRGVRVRDYSAQEVEHLYVIRDALERRAASYFDRPAPKELVTRLTDICDRHREASEAKDLPRIFEFNNRFHGTIYQSTGNRHLAEAIAYYTVATSPIRVRAFPMEELRRKAVAEHAEMIRHISEGNADALADTISAHIAGPKAIYLEQLGVPAADADGSL